MASALSPSAIYRIVGFVLSTGEKKAHSRGYSLHPLQQVDAQWQAVYKLYVNSEPAQPLGYHDSLEVALVLKGEVDDADVRAIFAQGKPMHFWSCPRLFVSKMVEVFRELQEEPTYLDVTLTTSFGLGAYSPSEAWPQVYTAQLPCYACTTVESAETRRNSHPRSDVIPSYVWSAENDDFAVERFHVASERVRKQLTVELHYELEPTMKRGERAQASVAQMITIRLASETCSAKGSLCGTARRSSATLLLLPVFTTEIFGYLDRAHVGSSLLANRDLHDLICQLKRLLPVHRLTCSFEEGLTAKRRFTGAYWLAVGHVQRDLSYTAVRRFKIPSGAGAAGDCALVRHYLSNSHVARLQSPNKSGFRFAVKMIASLTARNFSVGRLELDAGTERLSDYRSMDVVFGEMRLSDLRLSCDERRLDELVKTADFFRMSTVQGLRELTLTWAKPPKKEKKPRGHARSTSPLWASGIYLLPKCELYRVVFWPEDQLRTIELERKIVQICERGEITATVAHFKFNLFSSTGMNFAFKRDNLLVSGMKVEGVRPWDPTYRFEWDVYRFRNARTNEFLTVCVGQSRLFRSVECLLHILKGEAYPDASFADY